MKKSVCISLLIFILVFSFSSLGLAANTDVAQVLAQFEGDWSSLLAAGAYVLTVKPLEEKDDRLEIILSSAKSSKATILVGEVELTEANRGLFDYTFNPEEAKYSGGTIKFNNNGDIGGSIEISYIDKDNKKHVLIFNKQAQQQSKK